MSLSHLHYIFPEAFYVCLLLIPILCLIWLLWRFRQKQLQPFLKETTLSKVLIPRSRVLEKLKISFFSLSWLLLCFSLAGPYGNVQWHQTENQEFPPKKGEVMFLLDVSASMGVKDSDLSTRLEISKEIIEQLLPKIKNYPISLYAFTSQLIPLVPSTSDQLFFRMQLKQAQINEEGTQGTDIQFILKKIKPSACSTLILFSDGGEKELSPTDFNLIAVGMGSEKGGVVPHVKKEVFSRLEASHLLQLTPKYFQAQNFSEAALSNRLREEMEAQQAQCLSQNKSEPTQMMTYDLYYQIPLGIGIFFALLFFTLPSNFKNNFLILLVLIQVPLIASDSIETYNNAVKMLQEKKWREALLFLNSLDPKDSPSERFLIYLEINRAIAFLQLSQEPYTDSNYAEYLSNQGKGAALVAQSADCLWQSCDNPEIKNLLESINAERKRLKDVKETVPDNQADKGPILALKELIDGGKESLKLNLALDPSWKSFQKGLEKKLLEFVTAVLQTEKKEYYHYHCQIQPWNEVIPLIQAGYMEFQIAQRAHKELNNSEVFYYQNQALVNWKKALNILINAKNQQNENPTYALNQLEEMYLQDQKQPQAATVDWTEI